MKSQNVVRADAACQSPVIGNSIINSFKQNWKEDIKSGLMISLIALPLCLGIALASGFPAFGGIISAIVGGLIVGPICGSELTIKGPAAGLIAIAIASVETLGAGDVQTGYRCTLAVIVVASLVQVCFALLKLGRFGDIFPVSAVHGMLAAIGIIIFSKQIHPLLGVSPTSKAPLDLLAEIPHSVLNLNPEVAIIGVLAALFAAFTPVILGKKYSKYLPGPLLAVVMGIILSLKFNLSESHTYLWHEKTYALSEKYLVNLPGNFFAGVTFPDFTKLFTEESLQFVIMFALIGSLESLLTVKAVDSLDSERRKSDLNRDLLAVGIGNTICGLIGGLPMISEVVRSYANMSYGAKSRFSNFFHAMFLLIYAALLVKIIHLIPLAALSGVLCVTGYRLASPKHFVELKKIGTEQLIVFVVTIIATLMTDLLIGVTIGIATEFILSALLGAIPVALLKSKFKIERVKKNRISIICPKVCTFANVMALKNIISRSQDLNITIDFSNTYFIDHTFMREVIDITNASESIKLYGLDRLSAQGKDKTSLRIDSRLLS